MRARFHLLSGLGGQWTGCRRTSCVALVAGFTLLGCCAAPGRATAASTVLVVAVPNPDTTTNFSLAAIVRLSLRNNPDLRSFRTRREASLERPVHEKTLPNPMFNFSGMDRASDTTWPETKERHLGVQQEFPGFGKRELRVGIAGRDAELSEYDLETAARKVVRTVKEAYFDLISVQRVIALTHQDDSVLERLARLAGAASATGLRTQQDVLKSQSEIALHRQRTRELEAREVALKARLNALMNRRDDAPLILSETVPGIPDASGIEGLLALAAANRPEIRAAEVRVRRDELERQLKARDSVPDYKLGLEYRHNNSSDDLVMFTVGVGWPFRRATDEVGVKEAEHLKATSVAEKDEVDRACARDVQEAYVRVQAAKRTQDLYRLKLVPQALVRFTADEVVYQNGRHDFSELLASRRALLVAHVLAIMAEGDVGTQFARLEQAVGVEMLK